MFPLIIKIFIYCSSMSFYFIYRCEAFEFPQEFLHMIESEWNFDCSISDDDDTLSSDWETVSFDVLINFLSLK